MKISTFVILVIWLFSIEALSDETSKEDSTESQVWQRQFVHPISGVSGSVTIDTRSKEAYAIVVLGDEKRIYDYQTGFPLIKKYGSLENAWVEVSADPNHLDWVYVVTSGDGSMNERNQDGTCNFSYVRSSKLRKDVDRNRTSSVGGCGANGIRVDQAEDTQAED